MSRFRNYGFWISLTGAIILLLQVIGKEFGFRINEKFISQCVTAFCGVLVVAGILVKPNDHSDGGQQDATLSLEDTMEDKTNDQSDSDTCSQPLESSEHSTPTKK